MKNLILIVVIFVITGCASLQTTQETNIAVSALLDEIQIAINEIAERIPKESSLPPFKKAEVKLSTKATVTTGGSAALVLSGEKNKTTTDTNLLTLVLVPKPGQFNTLDMGTGHSIANYVIAAVGAIDEKDFLELEILTVEAGLQVLQNSGGGIEIELVGITFKGGRSGETTNSHSLKLIFSEKLKTAK